jgi:hypothetical protein
MPYQLLVTGASGKNVVAATPAATSNSGLPLQVEWEIELEARRTATDWPVATLNAIDAANLLFIRSGTDFEFRSSGNSNWLVTTGLTLTNFNTFRIRTTFDGTTRTQQLFLNGSTTPFATRTPTTANFSGFGALFTLASDSSRSGEFRYLKWTDFVTPANNRVWDARVSNGSQTVLNETVTNATASLSNLNYSWVFYSSGASNSATISGNLPKLVGSITLNEINPINSAAVNGQLPRLAGAVSLLQKQSVTVAGQMPKLTGSASLRLKQSAAVSGQLPRMTGSLSLVSTSNNKQITVTATMPKMTSSIQLSQELTAAVAGTMPRMTADIQLRLAGVYPQADAGAFVVSYRIAGDTVLTASISESTRFSAIISQSTTVRYMVS